MINAVYELLSPQGATAEHTDERKKENVPATSSSSSQSVRIKPAKRRTAGQVAAGRSVHHDTRYFRVKIVQIAQPRYD